jgi:DHA3 family macrolide efflux protein-like MFS transporter
MASVPQAAPPTGSGFLRFVVSQTTSMFGTSLTGFALGVWVYQTTGSVTRFALISFFTMLPGILLSPLAGAFVDRWDRRRTMAISDFGSGLCSLLIAILLWRGALQIWHIYVLMALSSTLGAPQMLAFNASIPLLVPQRELSRANGIFQLGSAAAEVGAPAIAGVLVAWAGVRAALLIDFLTCLVAIGLLLTVRIPRLERPPAVEGRKGSILTEAAEGWTYIRSHRGLLALMLMFTVLNLSRGSVTVLATPLVLAFNSPEVLGRVLSIGACGMVVGGILMTVWGGPRRRMLGIFTAMFVYGIMILLGGLRPNVVLITVSCFLLLSTGPFINGLGQALWHVKVPPRLQGRVTAMRRLFSWSALPLAYLVSGPLSDRLFEPWMARGGALAGSAGSLFGTGPGRGIGLFLSLQGLCTLALLAVCWLYPPLRNLEKEIPDADLPVRSGEEELAAREEVQRIPAQGGQDLGGYADGAGAG